MPALDHCHEQVLRALQNDGWRIEYTPVRIYLPYRTIYIDVGISQGTNGTRQQILVVEVKCFPDAYDTTRELYAAFGQYLIYRAMIKEAQRDYA